MAEPEDVEEDLFADLYDADDTGNQTSSAVETSQIPQPTLSDTPTRSSEVAAPQPVERFQDHSEDPRSVYQNPQFHGGYQHDPGSQDLGFGNTAAVTTTPLETEPQGTGIKEDGRPRDLFRGDYRFS
ncbi:hypothetical protein P170DRAFT_424850 [Aspergillus steynii IBT 23096]|uniref:Uncharacterized protein n=1 Tax=Aspergillus steynii IBT 23096 TaxID=1392250 RepID=A0A2I2GC76_9EURO|nr:uncharacterized protein P170DRAFT_424850 [Aspergillus steynii IBT 23096]PLB50484.1 hypothetical protein P170DRAFT_424850 [Aspergillus steynii IBT 23096]